MTDLEKALAKIEDGAGELREFDKCAARDIEEIVKQVREDELDSAREEAA